jgi:predicted nucleotidyltransferase
MLTELKNSLKSEVKDKNIFDIVLYGSVAKGKLNPRDVDIAVIFKSGNLKERLDKIQKIKQKINLKNIDIKALLLEELFQEEFFARSGIFLEGVSIFSGEIFAKKIGFKGWMLFIYNLKGKTHTEKVKFNYLLSGRNSSGIIDKLKGKQISPGAVHIPIINSLEFENILNLHKISFIKKGILVQD